MKEYNEEYIACFSEDKYKNILQDNNVLNLLIPLINKYTNKYDGNCKIDGEDIIFKESLDHYILKQLQENPSFINTVEMRNYAEFIARIYRENSIEVNTNVVLKNEKYRNLIIDKYLKDRKQSLNMDYNFQKNNAILKNIFEKMERNYTITQQEVDFAAEFIAKSRNKNLEENKIFLKYVFGQMKNTDLKFSCRIQDAVLSYLPFYYSNNLVSNTRYTLCDTYQGRELNGPGFSCGPVVVFNKNYFQNVNLKSIEDSNKERLVSGNDITFFMIVAFHEITHSLQMINAKSTVLNDSGLGYIFHSILTKDLNDYSYNHNSDIIEIEANKQGWDECRNFYSIFYSGPDKETLNRNCYVNSITSKLRRLFSSKKDSKDNYYSYEEYDMNNLSSILIKNPKYIEEYPMLREIFSENGQFKLDFLLNNDLYTNENCMMVLDNFFLTNGVTSMSKYLDRNKLSDDKISHLITNINYYILRRLDARDDLNYVIRHKSFGQYRHIKELSEEKAQEIGNYHYKKGLEAYKKAIPLLEKIKKLYSKESYYVDDTIKRINRAINKNNSNNSELQAMIDELNINNDLLSKPIKKM